MTSRASTSSASRRSGSSSVRSRRIGWWRRWSLLSLLLAASLLHTCSCLAIDSYDDDDGRGGGGDGEGVEEGGGGGGGEGGTNLTNTSDIGFEYGEVGVEGFVEDDLYDGLEENGVDEDDVAEEGAEGGAAEARSIHSSHQQRKVMLGDRFRLKCRPQNVMRSPPPQDFEAVWFFNSQPLRDTQPSRIRTIASSRAWPKLRVKEARLEDAGVWACRWSGSGSHRGWVNYTLHVMEPAPTLPQALHADSKVLDEDELSCVPPEFIKTLNGLMIKPAGNVAELKCQARGSQVNISWLKNGEKPVRQLGDVKIKGAMLKMENLVPADSGNYTCMVFNECGGVNHTYALEVVERLPSRPIINKELSNQTVVQGSEVKLTCSVISDLVPYITWLKHSTRYNGVDDKGNIIDRLFIVKEGRNITSSEDPQVLVLMNVTEKDAGWYTCIAANSLGTSFSTAYLSVTDAEPILLDAEYHAIMVLTGVLFAVLLIGGIVASFVWKGWQKEKRRASELERAKAITQHWIKKVIVEHQNSDASQEPLLVPTIKIEHCQSRSRLGSEMTSISEYELPLDADWELPRARLIMGESLGEGAFGKVVRAEVQGVNRPDLATTVAVKMLKEGHTDSELMDLVSEMEMMKMIGTHINIINLLGCCTQDGPLYVVVEYAAHGNLRDYLRNNRPSSGYERAIGQELDTITQKDLVSFAFQVARGMEYLTSKKCIHRDLAARNVLVSEDRIMKIADFGLARDIHSQDYYRKTSEGRLPVKWMAPEALFHRVYTSQSDVWAFGILLWEIMTLGGTPYPAVPSVEKLFQLLREGHRMEKPSNCSLEIYMIMRECWRYQPTQRPTFKELVEDFDRILTLSSTDDYLNLSLPHLDTPPSSCGSSLASDALTPH
ncbi:fibroblast growth factor receptor 4-like isoform X2 [Eriocheir sinensis]|uniref:fibroblast growth factor receptor 4-like isoform X2 n=1 Tax=Eriocheir sinensis TaxID=95602 RepID=UPI0021C5864C|nr:fibroblast growth factor receptor 4-like isoform X2 [Eriocheir sinensis]